MKLNLFSCIWRNLKISWKQIQDGTLRDPESYVRLIERLISLGLIILMPVRLVNEKKKLSKFFLLMLVSLITIPIVVAVHVNEKFSEMKFNESMENFGVLLCFMRYDVYIAIVILLHKRLESLMKRFIAERKLMREESDAWKLTIDYCKREFAVTSITILIPSLMGAIIELSVPFVKINAYRLPYNFYIVALPFDGISFNWFLNYAFQLIAGTTTIVFFVTYVPVVMLLINHSCWKVEALILSVEELDKITVNREKAQMNGKSIDEGLKKIIISNCSALDWINELQEVLKFHFLAEFSSLSLLLCVCLFGIKVNPFASFVVYGMVILPLFQLFVYCWMGSRLLIRIEKLSAAVYDVKWYNLNISQQKTLRLILMMTQNMKGFNGIFNEVNMETFQKILQFAYSLFTLLTSVE